MFAPHVTPVLGSMLCCGVLALPVAGRPVRQASEPVGQSDTVVSDIVAPTTPLRLTGTLDSYDARTQVVSIVTRTGIVRLVVTPTSRIRQGRRLVDVSILKVRHGAPVVLRYLESERGRVVVSLSVGLKSEAAAEPGQSG